MYEDDFEEDSLELEEELVAQDWPSAVPALGDDAVLDGHLVVDAPNSAIPVKEAGYIADSQPEVEVADSCQQSFEHLECLQQRNDDAAICNDHDGQDDVDNVVDEECSYSQSYTSELDHSQEEELQPAGGQQADLSFTHAPSLALAAAAHSHSSQCSEQRDSPRRMSSMHRSIDMQPTPEAAGTHMSSNCVLQGVVDTAQVPEFPILAHDGVGTAAVCSVAGDKQKFSACSGAGGKLHSIPSMLQHHPDGETDVAATCLQHRLKHRPLSASPAVQRTWSDMGADDMQQQFRQHSAVAGSNSNHIQLPDVLPVLLWTVSDVCSWVDALGMTQYRKKFVHHMIDGRLLMRLDDALLRQDMGIGPLGHRILILDGIKAVAGADLQQAARAAMAGTSPEDYAACTYCSSASAAAAVLVAGLIAVRAQQQGRRRSSSPMPHAGASECAGAHSRGVSPTAAAADFSPKVNAAGGRARPCSAPCKSKGRLSPGAPRIPSAGALGPAAGRISVYEQRAKILFELGRAQARAAATAGTAHEVAGVAQLALKDVAMLQGQLADLDHKHKLTVQHASGCIDMKGIIPWQHVGSGTNAADPFPERIARPWDSPDAELTFHPKISTKSQQLMAEARGGGGGGNAAVGFLDRLDNDMRRREAKQKELKKQYYSSLGAADMAKTSKSAAANLALLASFFADRGWATLSVPSNENKSGSPSETVRLTDTDFKELDNQLDEIIESYSEELGLGKSDSKQSSHLLAARGPKKLAAMVAVVRTQQFMDRYHADLGTRGSRLQQLQDNFFKQQQAFVGGRPAPVPLTPEQKDIVQAVKWFKGMGWQDAAESDDCDDLLGALIQRARHYKTDLERLHDKERAASFTGSAVQHAGSCQRPSINWAVAPWSADGLGPRMQSVLDAKKSASEAAAAQQAARCKPSAVDAVLGQVNKQGAAGASKPAEGHISSTPAAAAATLEAAAASGVNTLDLSVQLLAGMRWAGLDQLEAARGKAKKLAVYRALRTQQFLAFTAADLSAREVKRKALLEEFELARRGRLVSKSELDSFYDRLQADGLRRQADLEKARADKADREAKALALVSVKPGFSRRPRPRSAKA